MAFIFSARHLNQVC